MTKQELIDYLNRHFYYKGRGANNGEWHSYPTKENYNSPFTDFMVPHGNKDYGHVLIRYYIDEYNRVEKLGHEICIELNICSTWETHFQGWIQSIEDLSLLFRMLGIPIKEYTSFTSIDSYTIKDRGIVYTGIWDGEDIPPKKLIDSSIIIDGKLSLIRGVEYHPKAEPMIEKGAPIGIMKHEV